MSTASTDSRTFTHLSAKTIWWTLPLLSDVTADFEVSERRAS